MLRKLLSLTEEGKAALARVNRRARRLDKALLAGAGVPDGLDIAALLNTLSAHWESVATDDLR
ncbi:hypothetical protein [Kutzneria sp. NPDC052558]|uniref:hypothetical protein n=1 Tax=Kutzneria sp. NPDC052558 TaxID=3364121 RepID=UPI0037C65C18